MAVAKDELRRGTRSIREIALAVGVQSPSAFSTSFTRAVGCSPKRFSGKDAYPQERISCEGVRAMLTGSRWNQIARLARLVRRSWPDGLCSASDTSPNHSPTADQYGVSP
jgi:AraC-like DNA-binding protein